LNEVQTLSYIYSILYILLERYVLKKYFILELKIVFLHTHNPSENDNNYL